MMNWWRRLVKWIEESWEMNTYIELYLNGAITYQQYIKLMNEVEERE